MMRPTQASSAGKPAGNTQRPQQPPTAYQGMPTGASAGAQGGYGQLPGQAATQAQTNAFGGNAMAQQHAPTQMTSAPQQGMAMQPQMPTQQPQQMPPQAQFPAQGIMALLQARNPQFQQVQQRFPQAWQPRYNPFGGGKS